MIQNNDKNKLNLQEALIECKLGGPKNSSVTFVIETTSKNGLDRRIAQFELSRFSKSFSDFMLDLFASGTTKKSVKGQAGEIAQVKIIKTDNFNDFSKSSFVSRKVLLEQLTKDGFFSAERFINPSKEKLKTVQMAFYIYFCLMLIECLAVLGKAIEKSDVISFFSKPNLFVFITSALLVSILYFNNKNDKKNLPDESLGKEIQSKFSDFLESITKNLVFVILIPLFLCFFNHMILIRRNNKKNYNERLACVLAANFIYLFIILVLKKNISDDLKNRYIVKSIVYNTHIKKADDFSNIDSKFDVTIFLISLLGLLFGLTSKMNFFITQTSDIITYSVLIAKLVFLLWICLSCFEKIPLHVSGAQVFQLSEQEILLNS